MTDYWKNRFTKNTKDLFDSDDEYVKEIFKIYSRTIDEINLDIYRLLDSMDNVSMSEAIKLLNKHEVKTFKKGVDEFRKASKGFITTNIEKELDIISRRVRVSRLQAMQLSMKSKVATLLNKEEKKLFAHLSNNFTSSYYKDIYGLQRITGYKSINGLSKNFVKTILDTSWTNDGENFSSRIWKRKDKLLNTLDTELRQGLILGKSPDEITKVIADKLEVSKSNAKRLVLTESAAIHSKARKAMYERMGVEKYEIVATLDTRTSEICRGLDGKVFDTKDYEEGLNAPPFHVNCRSTTVPFYDDDIQDIISGKTRMARDIESGKSKRVENISYNEWFEKYVDNYDEKKYNIDKHTFSNNYSYINKKDLNDLSVNKINFKELSLIYKNKNGGFIGTSNSHKINYHLRNDMYKTLDVYDQQTCKALNNAILKNKINRNVKLIRYVDGEFIEKMFNMELGFEDNDYRECVDKINSYFLNSIIREKGFISTSWNADKNLFKDREVKLIILVNKGTNMYLTNNVRESEIVLRPSNFKVINCDLGKNYDKKFQINLFVEVVENEV